MFSEVQADLLKAFENRVSEAIAADMGYTDASVVSHWKEGRSGVPLDRLGFLLQACGLKVVPLGMSCVDTNLLAANQTMLMEAMKRGILVEIAL